MTKPPALPGESGWFYQPGILGTVKRGKAPIRALPSISPCVHSQHRVMWCGTANTTWSLYQSIERKNSMDLLARESVRSSESSAKNDTSNSSKGMRWLTTCILSCASPRERVLRMSLGSSKARVLFACTTSSGTGKLPRNRRTSGAGDTLFQQ